MLLQEEDKLIERVDMDVDYNMEGKSNPNCSSIYLSVCVSSRYRSFYLFTNQSIYLSIYLPIYLSTYPSISLSIYLSIYPAFYLLICLFTNIVNIYSVNCGSFGCHEFVLTFNPDVN